MFQQSFTKNTALPYYTYDQRGLLRNWSPQDGTTVLVDSLGLFVYSNSNSQILDNNNVNTYQVQDDDESCFQTSTGAWLLEYPHWDLVNNWQLPDFEALYAATYSKVSGSQRLIYASAASTISTISAASRTSQNITVNGASVGDFAFVTSSGANSVLVSYSASVTAVNTVQIWASNASAASQTLGIGNWYVLVAKQN